MNKHNSSITERDKVTHDQHVVFKEVDGVIYILDARTNTIHTLNESASFIWRHTQKPISIAKLTQLLLSAFAATPREATKDVREFVTEYIGRGFIKLSHPRK